MSRVSENSSIHAINYAVGKTKSKVQDLQLKGSTLKRVTKPSDDPVGNVKLLEIRSQNIDADQYSKNINFAQTHLSYTENALDELTQLLTKTKELAIGQASSIYAPEIRQGVAKEINQIRQQILSISNKRLGNRYIFSGHKVLTQPFDKEGNYFGDTNKINIEINRDVYVPININGFDVFYGNKKNSTFTPRAPATSSSEAQEIQVSIFDNLKTLENALISDNTDIIQGILEGLDETTDRVIRLRTQVGAITNNLTNTEASIEKSKLFNETHKSKIEDADVAELFSNLQKEQNVLKAAYKSSSTLMNQSLMDFLK